MTERNFRSGFAIEMNKYLNLKMREGYKEESFVSYLKIFDEFCFKQNISVPEFTKPDNEKWIQRRENEATTTHYTRVNVIKHFLMI